MPKPGRRDEPQPTNEIARFVDREEPRAHFRRHVFSATDPPVVVFYGVGGNGKSWLLKKLRQKTPADIPTALLDFGTGGHGARRRANLRRALAYYGAAVRVYAEENFPQEWAHTQSNLGIAWGSLPAGDRAANLRHAFACFEAALRVYTEQDFPQEFKNTTHNLRRAREALAALANADAS